MAASGFGIRPPGWVQDLLLAAFVTLFQLRGTALVAAPQAGVRTLDDLHGLGWCLLLLGGVALLARRRLPGVVFGVEVGISALYYLLRFPDGPGWTSLFVALYTVAAYGLTRRALSYAVAAFGALTAVWLLTAQVWPLNDAGWLFFRIGAAVLAGALGESVRARRALHAEAVARAERAEQERDREARQRVDAERLRIAREVHDTVAHAIAAINIQAGAARHVLKKRPDRVSDALTIIEQTSTRALDELRATLTVLRDGESGDPADSTSGQFDDVVRVARDAGLDVDVAVTGEPSNMPPAILHTTHRIVREAVTNVVRHADATRLAVAVDVDDRHLRILVHDNGTTPPAAAGNGLGKVSGHGIAGMRERCALLGGELAAGPHPAGGFQVRANLPLPTPRS